MNKKFIIISVLVLAVIAATILGIYLFSKKGQSLIGLIDSISLEERIININTNNQTIKIILADDCKLLDQNNIPTVLSSMVKGYPIKAVGQSVGQTSFLASKIKILDEPNIIVDAPQNNDKVSGIITISGRARVFEGVVSFKLLDSADKVLLSDTTMSQAQDIGLYGEFNKDVTIPNGASSNLTLEVFQSSAKDGSEIDKVSIPLIYEADNLKTLQLKVFFNNSKLDPSNSCNKVFSVEKIIPYTLETARAALEELLKGPDSQNKADGYFTSLPNNVTIQKITVENGIAKVDFSKELDQGVGGSCRVSAIRAQITETLKQFDSVKQVIISIDDRTEDILQP